MHLEHTTRYQELHNFKATRKGFIQEYSENTKASISSLQNKKSAFIESTTRRSSKSITSLNDTNISKILYFSYASNITTKSNAKSN